MPHIYMGLTCLCPASFIQKNNNNNGTYYYHKNKFESRASHRSRQSISTQCGSHDMVTSRVCDPNGRATNTARHKHRGVEPSARDASNSNSTASLPAHAAILKRTDDTRLMTESHHVTCAQRRPHAHAVNAPKPCQNFLSAKVDVRPNQANETSRKPSPCHPFEPIRRSNHGYSRRTRALSACLRENNTFGLEEDEKFGRLQA